MHNTAGLSTSAREYLVRVPNVFVRFLRAYSDESVREALQSYSLCIAYRSAYYGPYYIVDLLIVCTMHLVFVSLYSCVTLFLPFFPCVRKHSFIFHLFMVRH